MKLHPDDIRTAEIAEWRGLHLLHFAGSSCSQKLRIYLGLKGIAWHSHPVDLQANENLTPWFLGINPRGLVPVLVHDGAVHIESNDILTYLEALHPEPRLVPAGSDARVADLLRHEDDLHFDLRNLSFRFVFAPPGPPKSAADLDRYRTGGSGRVGGRADAGLQTQIDYWRNYAASGGIPDDVARTSALRFRAAFAALEDDLSRHRFLLGDEITVLDIAWFIYAHRLQLAGYPLGRLHPGVKRWFDDLRARPAFAAESEVPPGLEAHLSALRSRERAAGVTLDALAGA